MRVVFEEENNEVTVEVDGTEKEFPLPSDYEKEGTNNNATRIPQERVVSPRAAKFRKSVAMATAKYGESLQNENIAEAMNIGNTDNEAESSAEEGETNSSSDDEVSISSSVKILPRSKEEIEQEELEYQKAKDQLINQAVDKSFEKLAQLLRENGLVIPQPGENKRGRDKRVDSSQRGKHAKLKIKDTEVNSVVIGSNSETTIYDNAIRKEDGNNSK